MRQVHIGIAGIVFFVLIFSMGCIQPECPSSCDDKNACTTDVCGPDTNYACESTPISGDATGCSGETDDCHFQSCESGSCVTKTTQACSFVVVCEDFSIMNPPYEFYKSMNDMPSFVCNVTNNGEQSGNVFLSAQVEGYSGVFEKIVSVGAGKTEPVGITLSFTDDFYDLPEAKSALLKIKGTYADKVIYVDSRSIQVEKSSIFSPKLGDEKLVAMWVTYNDPCIEEVISEAKKFAPEGQFLAYMGDEETLMQELEAVFYSLYYQDMKYVSSTLSSTDMEEAIYSQDIRLPYRSLKYKQMNCIDGAVLYSAILEKLDYETGIAFIPGHAFVVVKDFEGNWIPIETTVTGDDISSFEDAYMYGLDSLRNSDIVIIDVHEAIAEGIIPMPVGEHDCEIRDLSEEAEYYQGVVSGDCTDVDYGYIQNGYCTFDNAAYCYDGVVYWDFDGSDCGGVYPNCLDADYGFVSDGYCTLDSQAYCERGEMYWAIYGECD